MLVRHEGAPARGKAHRRGNVGLLPPSQSERSPGRSTDLHVAQDTSLVVMKPARARGARSPDALSLHAYGECDFALPVALPHAERYSISYWRRRGNSTPSGRDKAATSISRR